MNGFLKENKAQLLLPWGLLPFVVLIFYILGGGKPQDQEKTAKSATEGQGVNYELPRADRTIEIPDKMEAYQQESSRVVAPDYQVDVNSDSLAPGNTTEGLEEAAGESDLISPDQINTATPEQLLAHIKQQEKQARQELEGNSLAVEERIPGMERRRELPTSKSASQKKPEQPANLQETGIEALDQVFDENIALSRQNDSLDYYLKQANQKLQELETKKSASFQLEKNLSQDFDGRTSVSALIKAEVYETTTVLDGNRVKLRLLEDGRVGGKVIPMNTFVYGICQIKNERLHIHVTKIPVQDSFLPVVLSIHDLDGMEGLYVPDNAARKVAKEVGRSTNTSSLFGVTADPLTYAGVRAADRTAQSLFKMTRLKKVTIKKNTLVYLINQK
jgi:conjugative transposon TraM protein